MDTELGKFNEKILEGLDFRKILISEIVFDDVIHSLFASANPVAGIRTTSDSNDKNFRSPLVTSTPISKMAAL